MYIDVKAATTKELIEFYNDNSDKTVKKFANRTTAENRILALMEEMDDEHEVDIFDAGKKKKAVKSAVADVEKAVSSLSDAIAESWKDPETREKRSQRSAVKVSGTQYGSVRKAFTELGLPAGECIGFRIRLKAAGSLKSKKAYGKTWTIIPLNYED